MAIKNFSLLLVALSALLVFVSCQTAPKKAEPARATSPELPPNTVQTPPPPATKEEPKKVAVILGSGGAKALAEVGVLRALVQKRIPIQKVVGLEWGALVGGLFSAKAQVHDAEWKLYKMAQKNLPHARSGFFSKDESIKKMDEYLADSFANETLADSKISFECPARSAWTGVVSWQARGAYKDAIKRCLPFPPVFKPTGTFIAGASQAEEAIERLRGEGFNVIILVNVLGSAMPTAQDSLLDNLNYVILWQEIKRSMAQAERLNVDVINVNTNAYPIMQFDAAKDLSALGETEGNAAAERLINKYGF